MTDSTTEIDELKGVYTFGSIYLTYIPLNDITQLLNEDKKYEQLVAKASKADAFQELKTFLNSERELNMNEALAFVQLDLRTGEAGYKKISDRNGAITKIPWSESTVREVGSFSDRFLKRSTDFEKKRSALVAGRTTVPKAWSDLKSLREDPLIPTRRMVTLDREFRSFVEKQKNELINLRSGNPAIYTAIRDFSIQYDENIAALKDDGAFKPIQIMIGHIDETRKKIGDTYSCYFAKTGRPQAPSEALARRLRDLGYGDAIKLVPDEDLIDFYQTISPEIGADKPAGVITTQPLRKLDFSVGKLFVALDIGKLNK